jgi:drug/metabolite transporter (DMT)-like permease
MTKEERIMSTRFISNIVIALVGVVVVVAGQAFSSGVTGQLTFGVSLGVLALAGVARLDRVAVSTGATAGIGPGRSQPDRRSS